MASEAERLVLEATKRLDEALRAREDEAHRREQGLLQRVERLEREWQAQSIEYTKAVDALVSSHEVLTSQVDSLQTALRDSQQALDLVRAAHKNALALGGGALAKAK